MITKESLEREVERIVRDDLHFLTQDGYTAEWSETVKKDLIKGISSIFSSKIPEILKEVIGEKMSSYDKNNNDLMAEDIGYNAHVSDCKSRASLRGFPVE